jgi:hypothetical protein
MPTSKFPPRPPKRQPWDFPWQRFGPATLRFAHHRLHGDDDAYWRWEWAFVILNGKIRHDVWDLTEPGWKFYVSDSVVRNGWADSHKQIFMVGLCRKGL